jgi:multimeric flavodoxin WrbA
MRVLLWIGGAPGDAALERAARGTGDALAAAGATVETHALHAHHVTWCQGCFECWTHTPGRCKLPDDANALAESFVQADAVVLVTRSACGGYDAVTKGVVDRLLGVMLPFFTRVDGEVHHATRYDRLPTLGVVALLDAPDAATERTLRVLVGRNALNLGAPAHEVLVIDHAPCDTALAVATRDFAGRLLGAAPARRHADDVVVALPSLPRGADAAPPTRAVVLVGSAKPRGTSTSEILASTLVARLATSGLETAMHWVGRDAHSADGLRRIVDDVRASDLLVLASPIYFDAYPSLVVRVMEALEAAHREAPDRPGPTVAALLNCGFPEARHAAVAAAIGALFARRIGGRWAGALALGAGETIAGRPLEKVGGMVTHLRIALDDTADALAAGRAVPARATQAFATPLLPTFVYLAAGDAGWLWTAAHHGALRKLRDRPYAAR